VNDVPVGTNSIDEIVRFRAVGLTLKQPDPIAVSTLIHQSLSCAIMQWPHANCEENNETDRNIKTKLALYRGIREQYRAF
jgi:hypothetical protein